MLGIDQFGRVLHNLDLINLSEMALQMPQPNFIKIIWKQYISEVNI